MSARPQHVCRGDWLQARAPRGAEQVRMPFWTLPPGDQGSGSSVEILAVVFPFQFIGPVHAVEQSDYFCSVLVPHPMTFWPMLAWMNIWSCCGGSGVHYAHIVQDAVLATWFRDGWQNVYWDGMEAIGDEADVERDRGC